MINAGGCNPPALRSAEVLGRVFAEVVADLGLHAAAVVGHGVDFSADLPPLPPNRANRA